MSTGDFSLFMSTGEDTIDSNHKKQKLQRMMKNRKRQNRNIFFTPNNFL